METFITPPAGPLPRAGCSTLVATPPKRRSRGRRQAQERLAQEGLQALPSASPEEFDAFIRREIAFWAEVVRTAGASVE